MHRHEQKNMIIVKGFWAYLFVVIAFSAVAAMFFLAGLNVSHRAEYLAGYMDGRNNVPISHEIAGAGADTRQGGHHAD